MKTYKQYGSFPMLNARSYRVLQPNKTDSILMSHMDKIEDFAWISYDLSRQPLSNSKDIIASDLPQIETFKMGFYAVTPYIYQTTGARFLEFYYRDKSTGLTVGEQLYTPRGTQGVGISTIVAKTTLADPTEPVGSLKNTGYFLFKRSNKQQDVLYKMRVISAIN